MKQVGILKKKGGAGLVIDSKGRLCNGWVGDHPAYGTFVELQKKLEEAKEGIKGHPNKPQEPTGSSPNRTQDPIGYEHHWDTVKFCRLWDRWKRLSECQILPGNTVFEDTMVFMGYSKGQSSFTLNFRASDGSHVKFGPSATGTLVENIISGAHVKLVDVVDHKANEFAQPDPAKPISHLRDEDGQLVYMDDLFTGKAIQLKFYFVKQGQNIYAHVYTGEE